MYIMYTYLCLYSVSEDELQKTLQRTVDCVISEFLQPKKYGLIPRDL